MTPEQAAGEIAPLLHEGNRVAIVFGCEDRGLSNADIEQCQRLVTIPTAGEASSLNLAQAILILTYECMKAVSRVDPQPSLGNDPGQQSRRITHEEQALLYARLKETLLAIDYLKSDNPDYFLMPPGGQSAEGERKRVNGNASDGKGSAPDPPGAIVSPCSLGLTEREKGVRARLWHMTIVRGGFPFRSSQAPQFQCARTERGRDG